MTGPDHAHSPWILCDASLKCLPPSSFRHAILSVDTAPVLTPRSLQNWPTTLHRGTPPPFPCRVQVWHVIRVHALPVQFSLAINRAKIHPCEFTRRANTESHRTSASARGDLLGILQIPSHAAATFSRVVPPSLFSRGPFFTTLLKTTGTWIGTVLPLEGLCHELLSGEYHSTMPALSAHCACIWKTR